MLYSSSRDILFNANELWKVCDKKWVVFEALQYPIWFIPKSYQFFVSSCCSVVVNLTNKVNCFQLCGLLCCFIVVEHHICCMREVQEFDCGLATLTMVEVWAANGRNFFKLSSLPTATQKPVTFCYCLPLMKSNQRYFRYWIYIFC